MNCKLDVSLLLNEKKMPLHVNISHSYWQRLKGWMFKKTISDSDALWIEPCNSIHTFFMHFTIDVVFISKQGQVLRCCEHLAPWSGRVSLSALSVLELNAGTIEKLNIKVGDRIAIQKH